MRKRILGCVFWFLMCFALAGCQGSFLRPGQGTGTAETDSGDLAAFSLELTEPADFAGYAKARLPVIVDYGSDSCAPCVHMMEALKAVNKQYRGRAFIKYADVERYPDIAKNAPVLATPTQVFFNADGTPYRPSESQQNSIGFMQYSSTAEGGLDFTVHIGELADYELIRILEDMLSAEKTAAEVSSESSGKDVQDDADCLEVHFLDVGQGDAILVICGSHAMLVDGGRVSQSSKIFTYLRDHGIRHLDYIVGSHPDVDHLGGLSAALQAASADTALSPVAEDDGEPFFYFKKYLSRQGLTITVPKAGDKLMLGEAVIHILGPVSYNSENDNDNSLVMKVAHGSCSVLLTGDAEEEEEMEILGSGADVSCSILKAAHHGSASSTTEKWLAETNPEAVVISCGANNDYGHPAESVLKRLKKQGVTIFRTDQQGDIIFRESDGKLVYSDQESNETGASADKKEAAVNKAHITGSYVLNTKSMKFHDPNCKNVEIMNKKNRAYYTGERQKLIEEGYSPCGYCKP